MNDIQKPFITKIINEDGSKMDDYPKNPLKEKWDKLYPPMRYGEPCSIILGYYEDGKPIMNYSCVLCYEEKCPHSNGWKVPEEDKEEYEKYQKQIDEYHKIHNPSLYKLKTGDIGLEEFMGD